MTSSLSLQASPYLELAESLFDGRLPEDHLPTVNPSLPPLDQELLNYLAGEMERNNLTQPRRGWAIMAVTDLAASRLPGETYLQALTAWQLARAANEWVQPGRVTAAIHRARPLFESLGEIGWVAACDWQLHALPWTQPDFHKTAQELTQALAGLKEAGLNQFVPHCRLSLAYAHILTQNFKAAEALIAASERSFFLDSDQLFLARCSRQRASSLRRQLRYQEAIECLQQASSVFNLTETPVDLGKVLYQLAYCQLEHHNNYLGAEKLFREAVELFAERDIELWAAMCRNGLAEVYNNQGRLTEAGQLMTSIRQIYKRHVYIGGQADNALESGTLALFQGKFSAALDFFQQAESLYRRLKTPFMHALSIMYQGEAHRQAGHYQRALASLEAAQRRFQQLKNDGRLADCQARLAHVWLELGQFDRADEFLERAAAYYQRAGQPDWLIVTHRRRAHLLLRRKQVDEAISYLREALAIAEEQGGRLQIAVSQRLLAEALGSLGLWPEAATYLAPAQASFAEMGMAIEQAVCEVISGRFHAHRGDDDAAKTAWKKAVKISLDVAPEIAWQAYAGLAELARIDGNVAEALAGYRHVFAALAKLRRRLWQPALAGSYLIRPAFILDQAISLAVSTGATLETLYFIEESKAQTAARQLVSPEQVVTLPSGEMSDLVTEIRWLQHQLQDIAATGPFALTKAKELQQQYIQKVRQYDKSVGELERIKSPAYLVDEDLNGFDLKQFRQLAQKNLGKKWLALNYYQANDQISCVIIGPSEQTSWIHQMSSATRLALDVCTRGGRGRSWSQRDLAVLGNWLLPDFVQEKLTADTHLLIAPHRQLHRLPWAALGIGLAAKALVTCCVPVIVPSLQSLAYLWRRQATAHPAKEKGLLLAVSGFQERHPPLPAVQQETDELNGLLGNAVQLLTEENATVQNLHRLNDENGLARFAFLHIASHAFPDQLTGRLSGLALYDADLWLDELKQLVPLPPLVTLSACSGIQSHIYEGDEHVGLATTCLIAGTQTVVGSLWPILDAHAPYLLLNFYRQLVEGKKAAQSLAWAQRSALNAGMEKEYWGSFQCLGRP